MYIKLPRLLSKVYRSNKSVKTSAPRRFKRECYFAYCHVKNYPVVKGDQASDSVSNRSETDRLRETHARFIECLNVEIRESKVRRDHRRSYSYSKKIHL